MLRRLAGLVWALGLFAVACGGESEPAAPEPDTTPGTIEGAVTAPNGAAARFADAAVELRKASPFGEIAAQADFDDKGRFRFGDVAPGAYGLQFRVSGFTADPLTVNVVPGAALDIGKVPLREDTPAILGPSAIEGVARRAGAGDLGHGGIEIAAIGTPFAAVTTAEGRFRLEVPPAIYTLRVSAAGYEGATVEDVSVEAERTAILEGQVVLRRAPGRIVGKIAFAGADGGPAIDRPAFADVALELVLLDGSLRQPGSADAAGAFEFDELVSGDYAVTATAAGFRPARMAVHVFAAQTSYIGTLSLVEASTAVDSNAVEGTAWLDCGAAECNHAGIVVETIGAPYVTQTGTDGRFRIEVQPGTWSLRFTLSGYGPAQVDGIDVAQGDTALVPGAPGVLLRPVLGRISGRVQRRPPAGAPVGALGAQVRVQRTGGAPLTDHTAGDGRFEIEGLRAGQYAVSVELAGHRPLSMSALVVPGEATDIGDLLIDRPRGTLRGRIERDDRSTGPATVVVQGAPGSPWLDGFERTVLANAPDDTFEFEDLAHGDYRLTATAPRHRTQDWVTVDAGSGIAPVLTLGARRHTLRLPEVAGAMVAIAAELDPDLAAVQFWVDDAEPPPFVPFIGQSVQLPRAGAQTVKVRFANDAWLETPDDLFAYVTPRLEAVVVRDDDAPAVDAPIIGDGSGFVTTPEVSVRPTCVDAHAPSDALSLRLEIDGTSVYDGPVRPRITIGLAVVPGRHRLRAVCTDWAEHTATAETEFVFDAAPPTIRSVRLATGEPDEGIGDRNTSVTFEATDDNEVVATALFDNAAIDCESAQYTWPAVGPVTYTLAPGDGPRRVFMCARDRAGRISARAESNTVMLDTTAPTAGMITLAGGAPITAEVEIALAIDPGDVDTLLSGDIAEAGAYRAGALPDAVTLLGSDGAKTVTAVYIDAAGNQSLPFSATIELDTTPPRPGLVEIAGGADVVNDRFLPVMIRDTAADRMRIWEADVCGAPTCVGDFVPFSALTSIWLSPGAGPKRICWQFCDLAGNPSVPAGSRVVQLGAQTARPQPQLDAIVPSTLEVFGDGTLVVTGGGIAPDTALLVDDVMLPCNNDAGDCSVLELGACASQCTAAIPDALLQRSGHLTARLITPDPVEGDTGTSAELLRLSIVAPMPHIERITPRGLHAREPGGDPPAIIRITVLGWQLTDDVRFRLGAVPGRIISTEVGTVRAAVQGPPAQKRIVVEFDTANLLESTDDVMLVADNPSPGGGEAAVPFGWLPPVAPCDLDDGCRGDLRPTRANDPSIWHRTSQRLTWEDDNERFGGVSPLGAAALTLRNSDAHPQVRYEARANGFAVPIDLTPSDIVEPEISFGRPAAITLTRATHRSNGDFSLATRLWLDGTASRLAAARLDGDAALDIAANADGTDGITIFVTGDAADGTSFRSRAIEFGEPVHDFALVDVNGDGHVDIAAVTAYRLAVRYGSGDGRFDAMRRVPFGGTRIVAGDFTGDGVVDFAIGRGDRINIVSVGGAGLAWWSAAIDLPGGGDVTALDVGDFDRDGALDLVAADHENGRVLIWTGTGDGRFEPAPLPIVLPSVNCLDVGDLDGDGTPDLIAGTSETRRLASYKGIGSAVFEPWQEQGLPSAAQKVELVDVDGDARLDIVYAAREHHGIVRGRGDGFFRAPEVEPLGNAPGEIGLTVLARLGDEGHLAYAVVDNTRPEIQVFEAGPGDRIGERDLFEVGAPVTASAVADLDGAAPLDLAVGVPDAVWLYTARPDGRFEAAPRTVAMPGTPTAVHVLDADNDDDVDVVAVIDGEVWIRRGDGDAFDAAEAIEMTDTVDDLVVQRIDPDPFVDFVSLDRNNMELGIRYGSAIGVLAVMQRIPLDRGQPVFALDLAAGDLEGNGPVELIVTDVGREQLLVLRQAIPRVFQLPVGHAVGDAVGTVAFGDIDGDGRLDVLTKSRQTGRIAFAVGDGTTGLSGFAVLNGLPGGDMAVGDMNGDGIDDVIDVGAGGALGGRIAYRRATDTGRFEPPIISPMHGSPFRVHLRDADGDGVLDVVTTGDPDADGSGPISQWLRAPATPWRRDLIDPIVHRTVVASRHGTVAMRHSASVVDRAGFFFKLRTDAPDLRDISLSIVAPSGRSVEIADAGPRNVQTWTAAMSAEMLECHLGWQPSGLWKLYIGNESGQNVYIDAFRMVTHGSPHQTAAPPEPPAVCDDLYDDHCGRTTEMLQLVGYETTSFWITGTTTSSSRRFSNTCAEDPSANGRDRHFAFEPERGGLYRFDTVGSSFDTLIQLRTSCDPDFGEEIACNDDLEQGNLHSAAEYRMRDGERIYVIVDGYGDAAGSFKINVARLGD